MSTYDKNCPILLTPPSSDEILYFIATDFMIKNDTDMCASSFSPPVSVHIHFIRSTSLDIAERLYDDNGVFFWTPQNVNIII